MPAVTPPKRVMIVGAGLAGMACAVALESVGVSVTLLEARRLPGGRAGSFIDATSGEELDNCQHVLLGCCTNLRDFYRRTNADHLIRWDRAIHFRDPHGNRHDLYGLAALPAPLHLGPSLARFKLLTLKEKIALARAMMAMARLSASDLEKLSDLPFGAWLDAHGQPPSLIKKLYDPVIISGLNEETRAVSSKYAIQIFRTALLANREGYPIGTPTSTLSRLYGNLPLKDFRIGARVSDLQFADSRVTGVTLSTGTSLKADAVVLATGFAAAQKYVGPRADSRFVLLDQLRYSPILGAHLWFDRPVLPEPHAAFIDGPLQWVFRKDAEGTALHGVISASRSFSDPDDTALLATFETQLRQSLSGAKEAKLLRSRIIVEKRATFSPFPGIDRLRPAQAPPEGSPLSNLYLAGDYTQTTWPATMEGAVRSGYLAAQAITGRKFVVEDLPVEWPARLMGL